MWCQGNLNETHHMKAKQTFATRRDLFEHSKKIMVMTQSLTQTLEIANRSDSDAKLTEEREAGNMPEWASSTSVFGLTMAALDRVVTDYYGITITELNVNWGGCGSWHRDLFEALAANLITA